MKLRMYQLLALAIVLVALPQSISKADPLPVGDVPITGTTAAAQPELAGPILEDVFTPYEFVGRAGPLSGMVESRVVRSGSNGTLDFYWRVIPDATSRDEVVAFRIAQFPGTLLDANWRSDDLGNVAPSTARNFGQDAVNFLFGDRINGAGPGVGPADASNFFFLRTDATTYGRNGIYDVVSSAPNDAVSATFPAFAPFPEPSTIALGGICMLGILARRSRGRLGRVRTPPPNPRSQRRHMPVCLAAATLVLLAASARAAPLYDFVDLHPAGFTQSEANGAGGGQQVGKGTGPTTGGTGHALLWTGSAATAVDLNPPGYTGSVAYRAAGGHQVGEGGPPTATFAHALLWNGSAASVVDLHPAGFDYSKAYGTDGMHQVGEGQIRGARHALLWTGTAASTVDLNPPGFAFSQAAAVEGGKQVGLGQPPNEIVWHALLWSGSAARYVDLNPAGSTLSAAFDISDGQQAGYANFGGESHAMLWNSTAASHIDLHPAGFTYSTVAALAAGIQVGTGRGVVTGGHDHALLWRGSAASYVDLHSFLPPGFTDSTAADIDDAGNVVGHAMDANFIDHAVMWVPAVPEPAAMALVCLAAAPVLRRPRSRA